MVDARFPDEDLPESAVVDGERVARPTDDAFDFVIVGSGAAGASAAYVLAEAGFEVGIVEEGPWLKTRDVTEDVVGTLAKYTREAGMQVLRGRSFLPMLQGRCVGGSTLVNSAIAWRIPEDVVDEWARDFGLGGAVTMAALEPHFDALERDLSVRPVADDVAGENNGIFLRQAAKMGIEAAPMRRYDRGCKGSGLCLTGCPTAAKQGMSVTYVPWALKRHGARIYTSCRVDRVELRGGKAVAVRARSASGHPVILRARRGVLVAASTVQTPNVLRRSGVRARVLGEHFQAHPGLAITGMFDRPVEMSFGATQGAESIHFRKTERFKLETISFPPDIAAARIPGVGPEFAERFAKYGYVTSWAAQIRARAEGRVRESFMGADRVKYTLPEDDVRIGRKAVTLLARMMFEAGAREVYPSIYGVPSVIRSIDQVKLIEEGPLDPRAYAFIATHLFGAARMGIDARTSVVDPDFKVHGVDDLWVVDSSVFPTNLGVNPQHSIMAMSRLAASRIAARVAGRRAA